MPTRLFHVSERPDIVRFEPRPPPSPDSGVTDDVVWAISEDRLHNYLLPRNCPRVTYYADARTSTEDRTRFFHGSTAANVVAIESAWLGRIRSARLWLYEFPAAGFVLADACAGYHVARLTIWPLAVTEVSDVLAALAARSVELRVLPSLWKLRDAVFASTLAYSFVRMRHAQPRQTAHDSHLLGRLDAVQGAAVRAPT